MRALIDYRPALRRRTGAGEYIHELTKAAVCEGRTRHWSISVFSSSWKDRPTPTLAADLGVAVVDRRVPGKVLNLLWHRFERPTVEQLTGDTWDVVHSAHPLLMPSQSAAQVITIHDLDFLRHPERTTAEIHRDYPSLAAAHAARADHIVTSSHFSANDIERELHVDREKITVCPAGAPEWPVHAASLPTLASPEPYILFLGTLEPRKNIGTLLDAYERLVTGATAPAKPIPPLVIAGTQTAAAQEWIDRAARPPLAGHVTFTGYVPDAARRALYEHATILVLPSHHEGFGLPVLEAMSLGVPVIASDQGSLPEVLGDAGLLVNPADPDGLTAAMRRLLENGNLASACKTKGRDRARQFTWRASAEQLIGAYELALDARERRR